MPWRPTQKLHLALFIYAATAIVFALTAPRSLFSEHTAFNHFALLAESWLHGRLDLGAPPPAYAGGNDFAFFDGKYFVSFPPAPALFLLPFVAIRGFAARVPDGLIFLFVAPVAPLALYLALERLTELRLSVRTRHENVGLAVAFAFGTVYWFTAVQGTVWFAAHVVATTAAALYLLCAVSAERPVLAGICLSIAFASRTPLVFGACFFLLEAYRVCRTGGRATDRKALAKRIGLFAAPVAVVAAMLAWHNIARFGHPFEFGHAYLDIRWRPRIDRWGLFSIHYLPRNLAVVLTAFPFSGTAVAPFRVNAHGLALWITTPVYLWLAKPTARGIHGPSPQTETALGLGLTAAGIALVDLLYQNTGWVQFGYRFSNDFAVFLFALLALTLTKLGRWFWVCAAFGVVVNGFGAWTFQRPGCERFYFVDPTQNIVHEPDLQSG